MKKILTPFIILSILVVFFLSQIVLAVSDEVKNEIKEDIEASGIDTELFLQTFKGAEAIVNPGRGMVCFNAKRKDNSEPNVETVFITGFCPFSGGCDLIRVNGGGAVDYIKAGGQVENPTEEDFTDLGIHLDYGNVDIAIQESDMPTHKIYFYYGRGVPDATPLPTAELGMGGVTGTANTQQVGTFNTFSFSEGKIPEGTQQNCAFIAWDPYGRVFDSVSLEPIPDIKVIMIDDKTKKPAVQRFEKNYDITKADGLFNILVENEGMYQLTLDSLISHKFVSEPKLNPNYLKIYYDIYHPGDVFEEKRGIATHHDIPLQPLGNPYIAPAVEVMKMEQSINMGTSVLYKGRISHPYAKVCLVGESTGKEIGCVDNADRFGVYQIMLRNSTVPQDEKLIPVGYKVNYNSLFQKEKSQQTVRIESLSDSQDKSSDFIYEPLLTHIEGYVYDRQGKILPNARVDVILEMNNKIVYTTYSDSSGFLTIYSKNLPIFDYFLQIIPSGSGKPIHYTTSEFVKANKSYLETEKINLMTGSKNNQSIIDPLTNKLNPNINKDQSAVENPDRSNKNQSGINMSSKIFIIVFIIFVLMIAVVSLVFYLKKN